MNEDSIRGAVGSWLEKSMGQAHVFTITFDSDFVTGNLIDGSFNAVAITQVSFAGTHDDTLEALRDEIQKSSHIFKATITGARQITCVGALNGVTITVVGPTVTGGATQPIATIATTISAVLVTVIDADQSGNKPDYPYATIRISGVVNIGSDELRSIDANNIATIGGQRRATVSINFYGNNPIDEMSKAANSLGKQTILDIFSAVGVSIWNKTPIQNLTSMLETKFEPRSFFDFFIGFSENVEDDLGIIETVELGGNIDSVTVDEMTIEV